MQLTVLGVLLFSKETQSKEEEGGGRGRQGELLELAEADGNLGQYFKKKRTKLRGWKSKSRLRPKIFHQLFPQLPHRRN